MLLDFTKDFDIRKGRERLEVLIEQKAMADLTKKMPKTPSQHNYVMALFGVFGEELGYTTDEAKDVVKPHCPFWSYQKKGKTFYLSFKTKDNDRVDSAMIRRFIDWFLIWASKEHGVYLMTADEYKLDRVAIDYRLSRLSKFS